MSPSLMFRRDLGGAGGGAGGGMNEESNTLPSGKLNGEKGSSCQSDIGCWGLAPCGRK